MTSLTGTLKASDLGFDNNDEGLTNFRSVAVHAMKSEEVANKMDAQAKELKELRDSDKVMKEQCITLQEDMDAHIEDRERVISHKTTQIQQLLQRQVDLQDELAREQEQGQAKYEKLQKESDEEIEKLEKKVKELDDAVQGTNKPFHGRCPYARSGLLLTPPVRSGAYELFSRD